MAGNQFYGVIGQNRGSAFADAALNILGQIKAQEDAKLANVWSPVANADPVTQRKYFDSLDPHIQAKLRAKGIGTQFRELTPAEQANNLRSQWQVGAAQRAINGMNGGASALPTNELGGFSPSAMFTGMGGSAANAMRYAQPIPNADPNSPAKPEPIPNGPVNPPAPLPLASNNFQSPYGGVVPSLNDLTGLSWLSGHQPTKTQTLLSAAQSFAGDAGAKNTLATMTGEQATAYQKGLLNNAGRVTDARVSNYQDEVTQRGKRANAYVGNLGNEVTNRNERTGIYRDDVNSKVSARSSAVSPEYKEQLKKIDNLEKAATRADLMAAGATDDKRAKAFAEKAAQFRQRANVIRMVVLPKFAPVPAPSQKPNVPKYDPAGLFSDSNDNENDESQPDDEDNE